MNRFLGWSLLLALWLCTWPFWIVYMIMAGYTHLRADGDIERLTDFEAVVVSCCAFPGMIIYLLHMALWGALQDLGRQSK